MLTKSNHIRYAVFVLWLLFALLEQITKNPMSGSLSECAAYILSF